MGTPNDVDKMSQQEVVALLQKQGIQVIMKPVALMPNTIKGDGTGANGFMTVETDIYKALRQLHVRAAVSKDPFS